MTGNDIKKAYKGFFKSVTSQGSGWFRGVTPEGEVFTLREENGKVLARERGVWYEFTGEKKAKTNIQVMEAKFSSPINALSGFYVHLKGSYNELTKGEGTRIAKELAKKNGFNPEGKGTSGFPCEYGVDSYTRSFWFYDRAR